MVVYNVPLCEQCNLLMHYLINSYSPSQIVLTYTALRAHTIYQYLVTINESKIHPIAEKSRNRTVLTSCVLC